MKNDQLRAFVAVVEQGSFRAAAAHIHKTQSAVSAAVQALEQEFNLQLLSREQYRPSLTSEGKVFYRQAKRLLSQADELEELGHQLSQGAEPVLSISLSAMSLIPRSLEAMNRFCLDYPNMRLSMSTEHLSGVLEQLQREKAELAMGPHYGLDDRYEFVEISQVPMVTVAAPGYIKESVNQQKVSHRIMRQYPHILISDTGSTPFDHIHVIAGGQHWYVNDYHVKKTLLLAGMGWARIPLHMVKAEIETQELVLLEIDNFTSQNQVPIYIIRLRDQPQSTLAQAFWNAMINAI